MKPYRDWPALRRQGEAGGYRSDTTSSSGDGSILARYIADQTTDERADHPNYVGAVDEWLRKHDEKDPPKDRTVVFRGWIMEGSDGDHDNALFLVNHLERLRYESPLTKRVYETCGYGRSPITLAYHITDAPATDEDLVMLVALMASGGGITGDKDIDYGHRYSELTGYLWTDDKFVVGGHDMNVELRSHMGKWCTLRITVHEETRK